MITKKCCVIVPVDRPSPIAFMNIYEKGDVWVKIKGCESCPLESRKKCCGNCPFLLSDGKCSWHAEKNSSKPLNCVIKPLPSTCMGFCYLEFYCAKGSRKGKTRRVRDRGNVFR